MTKEEQISTSEHTYRRLLEALTKISSIIIGPLGASNSRERAEGFRHLLRLVSLAIEMFVENGDRQHPVFTRWMEAGRKLLGDNPWTIYDSALIDSSSSYRIIGQRGMPTYLGFCVYGTKDNGDRCIVSNLNDSEMVFGDDGTFELILSKQCPADVSNWMELSDEATDVMVRQYFLNRAQQVEANYAMAATPVPALPEPLTETELCKRIDEAAIFVEDVINVETTISALLAQSTPVWLREGRDYAADEEAVTIDYRWITKAMPTPAILYSGSWVNELSDDEAVIVEGKPPKARYWSVQFLSRWMESPDYRYYQVFFTQANTVLEPDGSFRIAVSHRDPGIPNWLNTTGLTNGTITVRAINAEESELAVDYRRINLDQLT